MIRTGPISLALLLVVLAAATGFVHKPQLQPHRLTRRPPAPVVAASLIAADDDDQKIIARVQAWIKNMVIGLRLCPFAEGVVVADTVKYLVSKGRTPTEICTDVMTEALQLVTTREELVATTVIIAPHAFIDDFPAFYETELFLEEHLDESPLGEDVLVACFHPNYAFGGEPQDAPIHYEKRSPYPVFNLLRAQRVFQYADEGKTQRIAANNQETLTRTGIAEVRRRFVLEDPEAREGEEEGD